MLLLEKVFKIINESGLDYCVQNKYEMMPETIPSDIDMMYRGADEAFLDSLVKKIAKRMPTDYCAENSARILSVQLYANLSMPKRKVPVAA